MDVRSLILNETADEKDKKKKKNKTDIAYTVELQSGCDFAISRKTSRSESLLVILMSQDQFYIKDMKTGDIKALTSDGLAKFMSDLEEPIELPDINWIDSIEKGKKSASWIIKFLDQSYSSAARRGMLYVPSDSTAYNNSLGQLERINNIVKFNETNHALISYLVKFLQEHLSIGQKDVLKKLTLYSASSGRDKDRMYSLINNFDTLKIIEYIFGVEWAKEYVKMFMMSDCRSVPGSHYITEVLYRNEHNTGWAYRRRTDTLENYTKRTPDRKFKAERFVEYITYECCRQGKANYPDSFIQSWADCLRMQEDCYGTIRDKYPDALATAHDKLIYIYSLRKQEIDKAHWEKAVEMMKDYEWKPERSAYQIICPKKPEDMYDEASQQQNCLASYVQRVTDGVCRIFFLRSSNPKEYHKSIVTIEVYPDDTLGQVRARNNREPEPEHMDFVRKWAKEKNINLR